jgi:pimeloyl-ACP methyl ester carboxylesterase
MKLQNLFLKTFFNTLSPIIPEIMGKIGFYFFIRSPKLEVRLHHLEFLKTGEWKDLELNNKKVKVYKWGHGDRKVLLLHGWASNSFWWRHHIRTLTSAGYTVFAMDAPGNGLSEGRQLSLKIYAEAIKLLYKQTSTFELVAGHSFGGFVTMYCAFVLGPSFTHKIVVLGAPDKAKLFFNFFEHTLGFNKYAMKAHHTQFAKKIGHYPDFFDTAEFCKSVEAKGLIIHDKNDEDTPYQCAVRLSKSWTSAKFITTEGLGHSLKDEKVYKAVLDFANE